MVKGSFVFFCIFQAEPATEKKIFNWNYYKIGLFQKNIVAF